MDPLFAFEHVGVDGPQGPLVSEVTAEIPPEGVTVVMGPSGAGKSTVLRLCNRLEVASRGTVRFRGQDVLGHDPLELRRRVGMVFQRPTLFPGSVRDNLRVAAPELDDGTAAEVLERAELPASFLDRTGDDLSGGEAQRACLARTLVTGPEVLLMDEPTAALDERPRRALERLARSLADGGVPVVWVTHGLDQMRRLADAVVVLIGGRSLYWGSRDELWQADDPEVLRFLSADGEEAS